VCTKRIVVDARSASTISKPLERRCRLTGKGAMVSGSGVCVKHIVVDACHHMLGRLSSIIAKELLNDQKVMVVRCEEICLSASLVCQ
jgi:large subunit ribosomal protein L13Ae